MRRRPYSYLAHQRVAIVLVDQSLLVDLIASATVLMSAPPPQSVRMRLVSYTIGPYRLKPYSTFPLPPSRDVGLNSQCAVTE